MVDLSFRCVFVPLGWLYLGGGKLAGGLYWLLEVIATGAMTPLVHLGARKVRATGRRKFAHPKVAYPKGFDHQLHIRLLRLHRKAPFTDLEATLEAFPPSKCPQYDAVSYVWGDIKPNRAIILNECKFEVTTTVYNILKQQSSYFGPRFIWIDTICIDQENGTEKTSQIRKMRDIYAHSATVQIYLVDSPNAWLAVPFLHEFNSHYELSKKNFSGIVKGMVLRKDIDRFLTARIDALIELLENKWFQRAWVIQEFVVAQKITVNYSGYSFHWSALTLFTKILHDESVPEAAQCLTSIGTKAKSHIKSLTKHSVLLEKWRKEFLSKPYLRLCSVLPDFQSCEATKWQDKIFALVGFTSSAQSLSNLICYDIPREILLLEIANHFLQRGELVETFPYAGLTFSSTCPTNVPTWVADWTVSRDLNMIATHKHRPYNASFDRLPQVRQGSSRNEIIAGGILIDRIKITLNVDLTCIPDSGTIRSRPDTLNQALGYFTAAMEMARRFASGPYMPIQSMNQPLEEAISRTMIGDATLDSYPATDEYSDLLPRFIDHGEFIKNALQAGFSMDDIYPLPSGHGAYREEPDRELPLRKLMEQTENVKWLCGGEHSRRFCVTANRFIGMVPKGALEGDVVCILLGSTVPFILRPTSHGAYQLVGESYIHGIMDGKALETERVSHEFKLC